MKLSELCRLYYANLVLAEAEIGLTWSLQLICWVLRLPGGFDIDWKGKIIRIFYENLENFRISKFLKMNVLFR